MNTLVMPERIDHSARSILDDVSNHDLTGFDGKIYLDFSKVIHVDSSGLGLLLLIRARLLQRNIKVLIINMSETVGNILVVAHFDRLFKIVAN